MPDVKIYMPVWYRRNEEFVADVSNRIKVATAKHLECRDHFGRPLDMTPRDIDVMLLSYEDDARVGAVLIIEITGYDYDGRMANIGERLKLILEDSIPPEMVSYAGAKKASISYIPLPKGCWQTTTV